MTPTAFLSLTVSRRGPTAFARRGPPAVVVCLRGEHDIATVAELSATLARAITLGQADLVADLSRIDFMDASTVGVLTWARELLRARARSLVVRSPSTCARRVLELCDLAHLIEPRRAAPPMTEGASALGMWVAIPAIDGTDRRTKETLLDSFPETVLAGNVGATNDALSQHVHRRADEHPTRVA